VRRLEFRILGALEIVDGEQELKLRGRNQRALLALLLLSANRPLAHEVLVDSLWSGSPPGAARAGLHVAISKLRKFLAGSDASIGTEAAGYTLRVDPERIDAHRFETLVARGTGTLRDGDPEDAAAILREALVLWRGPALADLAYEEFAQGERARLDELRLVALEARIEADIESGRERLVVPELEALLAEHPLRERFVWLLMLALYRSGRQADALEVYRRVRRRLRDELGLEPAAELQQLEGQILRQDDSISRPGRAGGPVLERARRLRPLLVALAIAGVAAVAAGLVVGLSSGSDRASPLAEAGYAIGVVDAGKEHVVSSVRVPGAPEEVAASGEAVWAATAAGIFRIDPTRRTVVDAIPVGGGARSIAIGTGGVWATALTAPALLRVGTTDRARRTRLPAGFRAPASIATGAGGVWVSALHEPVLQVAPRSGRVVRRYPAQANGGDLAAGFGAVWVPVSRPDRVQRIDIRTGRSTSIPFVHSPSAIATGAGAVWVTVEDDDQVWRIDPVTGSVTSTIGVGDGPVDVAAGAGAIWVANAFDATISRVDPRRNRVTSTIRLGATPVAIAASETDVWVAVKASYGRRP